MEKMKYAIEIAKMVNGDVREVDKLNGVKLVGITIRNETNISPNIYIDQMYEKDLSIEQAAEEVIKIYEANKKPGVDMGYIMDFDKAKVLLRARLLNGINADICDVYKQAPDPFENLIIVPYLVGIIENGACKVTKEMIKKWNVSEDEVFRIAEGLSARDANMQDMISVLKEMMGGMDIEDLPFPEVEPEMIVVSNKDKLYGAYSIIPLMESIKTIFPNGGYTVLPSSVHEVIVVGNNGNKEMLDQMVQEINSTQVAPEEVLSDIAYVIK